MATELLAIDNTEDASGDVVVGAGEHLTVCLKDDGGPDITDGARVDIQLKDDSGEYFTVNALTRGKPSTLITAAGTYRFARPAGVAVGVFGEVNTPDVVIHVNEPVQLTGDVIVDTFGALDDAKETNPDAGSATIPALLRGLLFEFESVINSISPSDALKVVALDNTGTVQNLATQTTLADISTAIGNPGDAANDPTVIGLLKQIVLNTTG